MRIISGSARGLKLKPPTNMDVRPTTDRVKESLFNIINFQLRDSNILDLFSGTGSLGIECLSRGAKKCIFVDNSRDSVEIIKHNLKISKFESVSEVLTSGAVAAVNKISTGREKFDIIFMDPPYLKDFVTPTLEKISESNILQEDGMIIIEHDYKDEITDRVGNIVKYREKKYGKIMISFFKWED